MTHRFRIRSSLPTLALAALATAAPAQVRLFGLDFQAVGGATATVGVTADGAPAVAVDNLGSSGLDGVRATTPPAPETGRLQLTLEPTDPALPVEDISVLALGDLGGQPAELGRARCLHVEDPVLGDHWRTTFAGPPGTTRHTVELYDEGWRHTVLALDPGDALVLEEGPETVRYDGARDGFSLIWFQPLLVTGVLRAGGAFEPLDLWCTVVHASPDASLPGARPTGLELTASGVDELMISGAAQPLDGALASGLDGALVEPTSTGKLKVSNLGSSGCDGVSIAAPDDDGSQADGVSVSLELPSGGGGPPAGSSVSVGARCVVQGELHGDFGVLTLERTAPGAPDLLVTGCNPDLAQLDWDLTLSLGGQTVAVLDPDAIGFLAVNESLEHLVGAHAGNGSDGHLAGDGVCLEFDAPVLVLADAAAYQADEIALTLPAAEAWRVSSLTALDVTGGLLSELTVGDYAEQATPALNIGHKKHHRGHVTVLKLALSVGGGLAAGEVSSVQLHDAPPSEPGALFLSLAALPTPFKGGSLVTVPIVSLLNIVTDSDGGIDLPFVWPAGLSGLPFHAQAAVRETANQDVWISNALTITAP